MRHTAATVAADGEGDGGGGSDPIGGGVPAVVEDYGDVGEGRHRAAESPAGSATDGGEGLRRRGAAAREEEKRGGAGVGTRLFKGHGRGASL